MIKTPEYIKAEQKIEERLRQVEASAMSLDEKAACLVVLNRKKAVYRFIASHYIQYSDATELHAEGGRECMVPSESVVKTEKEASVDWDAFAASHAKWEALRSQNAASLARQWDRLYVYIRENAFQEEGDFVLGSHTKILEMDAFDKARYLLFSSHRWWRDKSNDHSTNLYPLDATGGFFPALHHQVILDDGTPIQRMEGFVEGARSQRFGPICAVALVAVVRQWVEIDDLELSKKLADTLRNNEIWRMFVVAKPGTLPMNDLPKALSMAGLPYTQSVQRFFEQEQRQHLTQTINQKSYLPRRGGLITTYLLALRLADVASLRTVSIVAPSGGSGWVTDNFSNEARKCMNTHNEWAENLNIGTLEKMSLAVDMKAGKKTTYPKAYERIANLVADNIAIDRATEIEELRKEMQAAAQHKRESTAKVSGPSANAQFRKMYEREKKRQNIM